MADPLRAIFRAVFGVVFALGSPLRLDVEIIETIEMQPPDDDRRAARAMAYLLAREQPAALQFVETTIDRALGLATRPHEISDLHLLEKAFRVGPIGEQHQHELRTVAAHRLPRRPGDGFPAHRGDLATSW